MLNAPPAHEPVTGHASPLAGGLTASRRQRDYLIRPARFKALTATIAIHVLVVAPALYGWHRSGQLAARPDAVVVTLPSMPDKAAQQQKRGMEEPIEQPAPPAPKLLPPTIAIPPVEIATEEPVVRPLILAPGGRESTLAEVTQAYRQAITTRLSAQRYYPQEALIRRYEGAGEILFRIDRTGRLLDVAVRTSTGWQVLDRAAVDQVRRAAPFPPIPAELPDELAITLPLEFLVLGGKTMVAAR